MRRNGSYHVLIFESKPIMYAPTKIIPIPTKPSNGGTFAKNSQPVISPKIGMNPFSGATKDSCPLESAFMLKNNPIDEVNARVMASQKWCSIVDAFQTAAMLAQEDYKLKHLAEQFRLADNLI